MISQEKDTTFKSYGIISGYAFGDYYYKTHADEYKRGSYQYSGLTKNTNGFQLRRIYLGYQYFISRRFSSEVLVDIASTTSEKKMSFYIKYLQFKWSNIFPNSNLIIGSTKTPTYSTFTEGYWGYRSVEKMLEDMHRSSSYDLGIRLEGFLFKSERIGYNLMVGNGSGINLGTPTIRKIYAEIYTKLFDDKLVIDLYGDHEENNRIADVRPAKSMVKLFLAYTQPRVTFGVSVSANYLRAGAQRSHPNLANMIDTVDGTSIGVSAFIRGTIIPQKLSFFARYDYMDPNIQKMDGDYTYKGLQKGYDPIVNEHFITAGLDFSLHERIHFIPNVWCQVFSNKTGEANPGRSYDLVYRMTFYFKY